MSSIHPDDTLLLNKVEKIRNHLKRVEEAVRTGDRATVGNLVRVAADLVRQAEGILSIVSRYING